MPTPRELQLIHCAARQVFGPSGDAQYRLLLRNVAERESAKFLTQEEFEDCMAVLEDSGFKDRRGSHFWRRVVELRGSKCSPRMARKIFSLAEGGRYEVSGMCERFSQGRAQHPAELYPREAWNLIEAFKAIEQREAQ